MLEAYSESFNSRMRDERLNGETFGSLLEAKVLGKEYRGSYNHKRLHSSLGYLPPAERSAAMPFDFLRYAPSAARHCWSPKRRQDRHHKHGPKLRN